MAETLTMGAFTAQLDDREAEELRKRFAEGGPGFTDLHEPDKAMPTRSLTEALARFQAELPEVLKAEEGIVKDKDTGREKYRYSYADLAAVTSAALPLLGRLGVVWITKPTLLDGRLVLAYKLQHVSGEAEEGVYPLPDRGSPQELGGAITYARRYALCSVTGIAPDDDDDAAQAQAASRRGQMSTPKMSDFERQTGLGLLQIPTPEQRAQGGETLMLAAFRQALDFRRCLHEKAAWELPVDAAALTATWGELFAARVNAEIAACNTRETWMAIRDELDAAELGRAYGKQLNARAHEIKAEQEQLVNQLTANVTNATAEADLNRDFDAAVAAAQAGRITPEQLEQIERIAKDRLAKIQREQNQAAR